MSWIRSAVNKAVEVGQKNNLSRIRSVADSVVQHAGQAVVGGAKILQDRINLAEFQGSRKVQSFSQFVKQLEELSISCRGEERIFLLKRWLITLKEVERINRGSNGDKEKHTEQDSKDDEAIQPTMVLYHDLDHGGEPLNFRDIFLHSKALEVIILSMILEAPNEEEVALLTEIFGICLMGGKEVHSAIVSKIQGLAKVFSSYQDEVLMKREELLQYAQSAITGLKMSADLARIDMEVSSFRTKLNLTEIQSLSTEANGKISEETTLATTEALQEALMQVQIYSNLKALLLEKKAIHSGDSPEVHAQKVDKLKILLESLAISTTKAENRIFDHRSHKEEALSFRLAKVNEVSQLEKELAAEIGKLERQKDVLETELRKVNSSLAFANARLRNAIEERQQFDEASNEILQHLQTKEEELSGSVASCRTEADVLNLWISFIEYAWNLQLVCAKQKEEQINDELGRYAEYFANLVLQLLPACKNELGIFMTHFKELVEKLTANDGLDKAAHLDDKNHDEYLASARERKNLEEKYLDLEAKLITTLGVVESIKQLYTQNEDFSRKHDERIEELLDALREIKDEFDSIKRPNLQVETPTMATRRAAPNTSSKETPTKLKKPSKEKYSKVQVVDGQDFLDSDEELATLESEFMKIIRGHAAEEINNWES